MTDQLGSDKAELLEALWDSYIFEGEKQKPQSREECEDRALGSLQALRRILQENRDDERTRLFAASHGAVILQLLVQRFAQDLFFNTFEDLSNSAHGNDESGRLFLNILLELEDRAPPTHKKAIDPMTIVLPRALFERLRDALRALDQGEIHPLVKKSKPGRHGTAWSRDEMQARALEHVSFLCGQGLVKDKARHRVADAMDIGSIETMKSWEKAGSDLRRHMINLPNRLEAAEEAGRISIQVQNRGDDAYAVAFLREIEAESLEAFGKRYMQLFGHRTLVKSGNQPPTDPRISGATNCLLPPKSG